MMDTRFFGLKNWLFEQGYVDINIIPLAGDASFRRYFRVIDKDEQTLVAMDAPPEKENIGPFVAVAAAFQRQGVRVPIVHSYDLTQGFMLLEDFGDNLYLQALKTENADLLYKTAIEELIKIQSCQQVEHHALPRFDFAFMMKELSLFEEWFLEKHLKINCSLAQKKLLKQTFTQLIECIEKQPQICVHRDYHSRNLIWCADQRVGVLDFQDAVIGPMSYDLVSLLEDCYIDWPNHQVRNWVAYYFDLASMENLSMKVDFEIFYQWFACMGIQRHLKAAFIFARLNLLYNKPGYLEYIPRTMTYVRNALELFPQMHPFKDFLSEVGF